MPEATEIAKKLKKSTESLQKAQIKPSSLVKPVQATQPLPIPK